VALCFSRIADALIGAITSRKFHDKRIELARCITLREPSQETVCRMYAPDSCDGEFFVFVTRVCRQRGDCFG
jgi:hypothetical protein